MKRFDDFDEHDDLVPKDGKKKKRKDWKEKRHQDNRRNDQYNETDSREASRKLSDAGS